MHSQMIRITPPQKSLVHPRPQNLHRQVHDTRRSSVPSIPEKGLDTGGLYQSGNLSVNERQKRAYETFKTFHSLQTSHLLSATVKSVLLHQIAPVLVEAVYNISDPRMENWKACNWEELLDSEHFFQLEHLEQLVKEMDRKKKLAQSRYREEMLIGKSFENRLVTLRSNLQLLETDQIDVPSQKEAEAVAVEKSEKKYAFLISQEERKREHCEFLAAKLKSYQERGNDIAKIEAEAKKVLQDTFRDEQEETFTQQLREMHQAVLCRHEKLQGDKQLTESKIQKLEQQITIALCKKCSAHEVLSGLQQKLEKLVECDQIQKGCLTPRPEWKRIVCDAPELKHTTRHETVDPNQLIFAVENSAEMISKDFTSINQAHDNVKYWLGTDESVRVLLIWIDYYTKQSTPELQMVWIAHEIEKVRSKLVITQEQLEMTYNKFRELSGSLLDLETLLEQAKQMNEMPSGLSSQVTTILPNLEQCVRRERIKIKLNHVIGLGVHNEVPKYLRHQGKVRMHHFEKAIVDDLIRKVCTEKLNRDARYAGLHVSIDMALYERLYRKLGYQPKIAEFGYSLLLALNEYVWDTEVEMFLLCLTGTLCDQIYSEQEQMLRTCRQYLLTLSHTLAQTLVPSSMEAVVLLQDAIKALKNFFPRKTSTQFKEIEKALIINLHDASHDAGQMPFQINKVLPLCDSELMLFRSGALIRTLREQHFKEIREHYSLLLNALKVEDIECTGYLSFGTVVNVMCVIDPDALRDTIVKQLIQAMGIRPAKILHETDHVHYPTLLQKMNQMMVLKYTRNYHTQSPWSPRASNLSSTR